MVREAERRKQKFQAKVDPEVLRRQILALKPLMVEGQAKYFPEIATVEQKVKRLVEAQGETTLKVRDYLNFGREMYELSQKFSGATLAAEAQLKVNKWADRGLRGDLLVKIAQFFGVTPTAFPPPPLIIYLDDLEDVEITAPSDKQVLTYEEASKLWKNKALPPSQLSWMSYRRSGRYHSIPILGYVETITCAANYLWALAFYVPKTTAFDRIAIHVTTSASGKARLGVYADDGTIYPGALVLDAGEVNVGTTGVKEISINLTLQAGLYWLLVTSNVTPTLGGLHHWFAFAPIGTATPYASGYDGWYISRAYGSLPSTFPAGASMSNSMPVWIMLRKA